MKINRWLRIILEFAIYIILESSYTVILEFTDLRLTNLLSQDHLRLLSVICNPGMVNRHWLQIADLFQGDQEFVIDTASSLSVMIDMKLNDKIEKLEEISTAATKEHTLETNLSKMQEEWKEMVFTFLPYRDTGTYIISALDEIQVISVILPVLKTDEKLR